MRILFIDDQQDFLDSISFWMKSKGYEVEVALDGKTGIKKIREGSIDVAFVDYKMPEMNGLEVIAKVREFDSNIPLVIVTAHADNIVFGEVKKLRVSGFFSKIGPFEELDQVLDVVVRQLEKKKTDEEAL